MSTKETYNGWSNRETWALMLQIENDMGLNDEFQGLAREVAEGECEYPFLELSERIQLRAEVYFTVDAYQEEFGERMPESLQRIAEDIGSLYRVDWAECARAFLDDVAENARFEASKDAN